ncbi:TBPIP-domain-containing protein [Paxillus ammoniavirescens]|nr:TBPIP-domain-containing protein [Paxillus ammoniavirescens]
MAAKAKNPDVKVLKGQEAEDAILQYMTRMNRPFGAVDISANLKGAVPKATTAKILVALAEKGAIIQKTYGKTNFYVVNQSNIETLPANDLTVLEAECKAVADANNSIAADVKNLSAELGKLRSTPTDAELDAQIEAADQTIYRLLERLAPLRNGTPLISTEDLVQIDSEWAKWRPEWVRRKKIFTSFWQLATDALPPQDATSLADDLGIEFDTPEHMALERGPICAAAGTNSRTNLKRKRE